MDNMIEVHTEFKGKFSLQNYPNGQLAVYYNDFDDFPIAELSLMDDSADLGPNEFILKDYSENADLIETFLELGVILPTDRFVLVGGRLCPICRLR